MTDKQGGTPRHALLDRIPEMLGGRLEVSSKPGRGTAVDIRVPLAD